MKQYNESIPGILNAISELKATIEFNKKESKKWFKMWGIRLLIGMAICGVMSLTGGILSIIGG